MADTTELNSTRRPPPMATFINNPAGSTLGSTSGSVTIDLVSPVSPASNSKRILEEMIAGLQAEEDHLDNDVVYNDRGIPHFTLAGPEVRTHSPVRGTPGGSRRGSVAITKRGPPGSRRSSVAPRSGSVDTAASNADSNAPPPRLYTRPYGMTDADEDHLLLLFHLALSHGRWLQRRLLPRRYFFWFLEACGITDAAVAKTGVSTVWLALLWDRWEIDAEEKTEEWVRFRDQRRERRRVWWEKECVRKAKEEREKERLQQKLLRENPASTTKRGAAGKGATSTATTASTTTAALVSAASGDFGPSAASGSYGVTMSSVTSGGGGGVMSPNAATKTSNVIATFQQPPSPSSAMFGGEPGINDYDAECLELLHFSENDELQHGGDNQSDSDSEESDDDHQDDDDEEDEDDEDVSASDDDDDSNTPVDERRRSKSMNASVMTNEDASLLPGKHRHRRHQHNRDGAEESVEGDVIRIVGGVGRKRGSEGAVVHATAEGYWREKYHRQHRPSSLQSVTGMKDTTDYYAKHRQQVEADVETRGTGAEADAFISVGGFSPLNGGGGTTPNHAGGGVGSKPGRGNTSGKRNHNTTNPSNGNYKDRRYPQQQQTPITLSDPIPEHRRVVTWEGFVHMMAEIVIRYFSIINHMVPSLAVKKQLAEEAANRSPQPYGLEPVSSTSGGGTEQQQQQRQTSVKLISSSSVPSVIDRRKSGGVPKLMSMLTTPRNQVGTGSSGASPATGLDALFAISASPKHPPTSADGGTAATQLFASPPARLGTDSLFGSQTGVATSTTAPMHRPPNPSFSPIAASTGSGGGDAAAPTPAWLERWMAVRGSKPSAPALGAPSSPTHNDDLTSKRSVVMSQRDVTLTTTNGGGYRSTHGGGMTAGMNNETLDLGGKSPLVPSLSAPGSSLPPSAPPSTAGGLRSVRFPHENAAVNCVPVQRKSLVDLSAMNSFTTTAIMPANDLPLVGTTVGGSRAGSVISATPTFHDALEYAWDHLFEAYVQRCIVTPTMIVSLDRGFKYDGRHSAGGGSGAGGWDEGWSHTTYSVIRFTMFSNLRQLRHLFSIFASPPERSFLSFDKFVECLDAVGVLPLIDPSLLVPVFCEANNQDTRGLSAGEVAQDELELDEFLMVMILLAIAAFADEDTWWWLVSVQSKVVLWMERVMKGFEKFLLEQHTSEYLAQRQMEAEEEDAQLEREAMVPTLTLTPGQMSAAGASPSGRGETQPTRSQTDGASIRHGATVDDDVDDDDGAHDRRYRKLLAKRRKQRQRQDERHLRRIKAFAKKMSTIRQAPIPPPHHHAWPPQVAAVEPWRVSIDDDEGVFVAGINFPEPPTISSPKRMLHQLGRSQSSAAGAAGSMNGDRPMSGGDGSMRSSRRRGRNNNKKLANMTPPPEVTAANLDPERRVITLAQPLFDEPLQVALGLHSHSNAQQRAVAAIAALSYMSETQQQAALSGGTSAVASSASDPSNKGASNAPNCLTQVYFDKQPIESTLVAKNRIRAMPRRNQFLPFASSGENGGDNSGGGNVSASDFILFVTPVVSTREIGVYIRSVKLVQVSVRLTEQGRALTGLSGSKKRQPLDSRGGIDDEQGEDVDVVEGNGRMSPLTGHRGISPVLPGTPASPASMNSFRQQSRAHMSKPATTEITSPLVIECGTSVSRFSLEDASALMKFFMQYSRPLSSILNGPSTFRRPTAFSHLNSDGPRAGQIDPSPPMSPTTSMTTNSTTTGSIRIMTKEDFEQMIERSDVVFPPTRRPLFTYPRHLRHSQPVVSIRELFDVFSGSRNPVVDVHPVEPLVRLTMEQEGSGRGGGGGGFDAAGVTGSGVYPSPLESPTSSGTPGNRRASRSVRAAEYAQFPGLSFSGFLHMLLYCVFECPQVEDSMDAATLGRKAVGLLRGLLCPGTGGPGTVGGEQVMESISAPPLLSPSAVAPTFISTPSSELPAHHGTLPLSPGARSTTATSSFVSPPNAPPPRSISPSAAALMSRTTVSPTGGMIVRSQLFSSPILPTVASSPGTNNGESISLSPAFQRFTTIPHTKNGNTTTTTTNANMLMSPAPPLERPASESYGRHPSTTVNVMTPGSMMHSTSSSAGTRPSKDRLLVRKQMEAHERLMSAMVLGVPNEAPDSPVKKKKSVVGKKGGNLSRANSVASPPASSKGSSGGAPSPSSQRASVAGSTSGARRKGPPPPKPPPIERGLKGGHVEMVLPPSLENRYVRSLANHPPSEHRVVIVPSLDRRTGANNSNGSMSEMAANLTFLDAGLYTSNSTQNSYVINSNMGGHDGGSGDGTGRSPTKSLLSAAAAAASLKLEKALSQGLLLPPPALKASVAPPPVAASNTTTVTTTVTTPPSMGGTPSSNGAQSKLQMEVFGEESGMLSATVDPTGPSSKNQAARGVQQQQPSPSRASIPHLQGDGMETPVKGVSPVPRGRGASVHWVDDSAAAAEVHNNNNNNNVSQGNTVSPINPRRRGTTTTPTTVGSSQSVMMVVPQPPVSLSPMQPLSSRASILVPTVAPTSVGPAAAGGSASDLKSLFSSQALQQASASMVSDSSSGPSDDASGPVPRPPPPPPVQLLQCGLTLATASAPMLQPPNTASSAQEYFYSSGMNVLTMPLESPQRGNQLLQPQTTGGTVVPALGLSYRQVFMSISQSNATAMSPSSPLAVGTNQEDGSSTTKKQPNRSGVPPLAPSLFGASSRDGTEGVVGTSSSTKRQAANAKQRPGSQGGSEVRPSTADSQGLLSASMPVGRDEALASVLKRGDYVPSPDRPMSSSRAGTSPGASTMLPFTTPWASSSYNASSSSPRTARAPVVASGRLGSSTLPDVAQPLSSRPGSEGGLRVGSRSGLGGGSSSAGRSPLSEEYASSSPSSVTSAPSAWVPMITPVVSKSEMQFAVGGFSTETMSEHLTDAMNMRRAMAPSLVSTMNTGGQPAVPPPPPRGTSARTTTATSRHASLAPIAV